MIGAFSWGTGRRIALKLPVAEATTSMAIFHLEASLTAVANAVSGAERFHNVGIYSDS
jgi:hypothetical protein